MQTRAEEKRQMTGKEWRPRLNPGSGNQTRSGIRPTPSGRPHDQDRDALLLGATSRIRPQDPYGGRQLLRNVAAATGPFVNGA